ncbi:MAG: UPF0489 family protein [Gammaproteobacteria bacterium]
MDEAAFAALDEDPDFYADLGNGVWLMDDHRWAFYIWQRCHAASVGERFSLIHADFHWDGINDFHDQPTTVEKLLSADDAELLELVRNNELIRYDSFIAPAVIRGFLEEVHFYCKQDDGSDVGLDDELLQRFGCAQRIHEHVHALATQTFRTPLIFDLCLDLFNRSDMMYEGDIWPDEEVNGFLAAVTPLIERAKLVTISLSFGCSGSVDDTRRLANLVVPRIMNLRQ